MLLPRADSAAHLPGCGATARSISPPPACAAGEAIVVEIRNPRFLNAEDEATLDDFEIAIDLAILDDATPIAVLRGGHVQHPKYAGRRMFSAGINLTHLYQGRIPLPVVPRARHGAVHKMFRGLADARHAAPDEVARRHGKSRGSRRSMASPSAAAARSCW